MKFEYLADYPDSVPQIISWWHTIWADRMGSDLAALEQQLLTSLSKDQLPLHIVATKAGQPIGTAALKLQELAGLFPDKQFWLGSVFVEESHRGSGIASDMTMKIVELARARELPHLKADGDKIWTYRHALVPNIMPKKLLVVCAFLHAFSANAVTSFTRDAIFYSLQVVGLGAGMNMHKVMSKNFREIVTAEAPVSKIKFVAFPFTVHGT